MGSKNRVTVNVDELNINEKDLKDKIDMETIEMCYLDQQVSEIAILSGMSESATRKFLIAQRKHAQRTLSLGGGYNLTGIASISPKKKGDKIILTATVCQTISRPSSIKYSYKKGRKEANGERINIDEDL